MQYLDEWFVTLSFTSYFSLTCNIELPLQSCCSVVFYKQRERKKRKKKKSRSFILRGTRPGHKFAKEPLVCTLALALFIWSSIFFIIQSLSFACSKTDQYFFILYLREKKKHTVDFLMCAKPYFMQFIKIKYRNTKSQALYPKIWFLFLPLFHTTHIILRHCNGKNCKTLV